METGISGFAVADQRPDRHSRYNNGEKGRARYDRYNDKRAEKRIREYLVREFVAWDGEGGNEPDGSHTYFLLANSDGQSLSVRGGISTVQVFEMLLSARDNVTHIGYGLSYDINMWLRDVDRESLELLYKTGSVRWGQYFLEWRGGKSFKVRAYGKTRLIYDVLPFFQRSFVTACDEYLGNDPEWQEIRESVIADKARRGTFDWSELDGIAEYNGRELATLVRLANELKARLFAVEIRVSRWDGPGAIASALFKKYDTKSYLAPTPHLVAEAGRHAYAGGRFEIVRKGHSETGSYQYDLRSAYPSAARFLPCLAHGRWEHRINPTRIVPFGIYRIETDHENPPMESETQPQPLWMRNRDGTVHFAMFVHGWYWSPEAELAKELGGHTFHESWEWIAECDHVPFWFVEGLYNKRAALKKAGDGAHVGLKLGLNSLYGKLAQQIGWDPGPPLKLPTYHSLEWAGYITSHCRSQVLRAALTAPDDIIAFETDAVFSRVPLDLDIGERLGQWDETKYSSLTYVKSGMYFGTKVDGEQVEKCRGINKGTLTREEVIQALEAEKRGNWVCPVEGCEEPPKRGVHVHATQTRFIGLGVALHQDFNKWRKWFTMPRILAITLSGKRIDIYDNDDVRKDLADGWEETVGGFTTAEFSQPYEVAWIEKTDIGPTPGTSLSDYRIETAHDRYEWEFE